MTRYCLVQDDDSHWYVIPVDMQSHWEEWLDGIDWTIPSYADAVAGWPGLVSFTEYKISG